MLERFLRPAIREALEGWECVPDLAFVFVTESARSGIKNSYKKQALHTREVAADAAALLPPAASAAAADSAATAAAHSPAKAWMAVGT